MDLFCKINFFMGIEMLYIFFSSKIYITKRYKKIKFEDDTFISSTGFITFIRDNIYRG